MQLKNAVHFADCNFYFSEDTMTNINCSKNCIYQKDGKCSYDNVGFCATHIEKDNDGCLYQMTNEQAEKLNIKAIQ